MNAGLAVIMKDLRLAWRDRAGWTTAGAFAMIAVLVYSFAFDLAVGDPRPLLPGVLWTTFLFAGVFASGPTVQRETDEGTFDALLLAPVPPTVIYLGKAIANLIALLVIEFAVLAVATILFGIALLTATIVGIVIVGTAGFVSLTTLLSTLGASTRARGMLLPVLALPLLIPLLLAAVRATGAALDIEPEAAPWSLLLGVFALWSALIATILFPLAVER